MSYFYIYALGTKGLHMTWIGLIAGLVRLEWLVAFTVFITNYISGFGVRGFLDPWGQLRSTSVILLTHGLAQQRG